MFKRSASIVAGVLLLVSPIIASAQTTDLQAQINELLRRIADLTAIVASLQGNTTTPTAPACVSLSYNLFSGSTDALTGGEVSRLQQFLGISPTTGYFGPRTESAVQEWQSSHGVVSSGSPDSTGYGYVGNQTREAMACGRSSQPAPIYSPPSNIGIQNSPTNFKDNKKIILLVQNDIADTLATELATYSNDISSEYGFRTVIKRVQSADTTETLKNYVVGEYNASGLAGVLIVGNVPTGNFYNPEIDSGSVFNSQGNILSDSIYQDISSACTYHPDRNAYTYENWNCAFVSTGAYPYWIGRITPNSSLQSNTVLIKDYFHRNHAYRTGAFSYQHNVLVYVPLPEAPSDAISGLRQFSFFNAYTANQVNIVDRASATSDQTYLAELAKSHQYEIVYYNGHGAPTSQEKNIRSLAVSNRASEEGLSAPRSLSVSKASAFLGFFGSCSVGRFTTADYIAGEYLFSDSLVTLAPTTPVFSATQAPKEFTYLLLSGQPVFEAIKIMPLRAMNLLGDPTLRMRYNQAPSTSNKPIISVDKNQLAFSYDAQESPLTIRNDGNSQLLFRESWIFTSQENPKVSLPFSSGSAESLSSGIAPHSAGLLTFMVYPWENLRVGTSSGTVYVFSNDLLNPIIKIPFTIVKKDAVQPRTCSNGLDISKYPSCTCPSGQSQQGSNCIVPTPTATTTTSDFIVGDVRAEGSAIAGQPLRLKVSYRDVNGLVRAGTSATLNVGEEAVSSAYFTGAYADVAYVTIPAAKVVAGSFNAVVTINKNGAIAESDRTNNTLTTSIPVANAVSTTTVTPTPTPTVTPSSITATPNPVKICDGSGLGTTTINAIAGSNYEIRVSSPSGALFANMSANNRTDKPTGKWVTNGMTFYVIDTVTRQTLSTTRVDSTTSGCVAPPTPTPPPTPTTPTVALNILPKGNVEASNCTLFQGWAYDPNASSTSIGVIVKEGDVTRVSGTANMSRDDVNLLRHITGNHGFSIPTPASLKDGVTRTLRVYGVDTDGTSLGELFSNPRTVTCGTVSTTTPITTAQTAAVIEALRGILLQIQALVQ